MQFGSLQEVIHQYIHNGQSVALEGFTHLIPFAAGHEILRQKKHDLHLIRMTPDLIYDQLIGAGCARALTFSWGGNPGVVRCTGCAMRSRMTGRDHCGSTSIRTRGWLRPIPPGQPGCPSECCAATSEPIFQASTRKCAKYVAHTQIRRSLRCRRSIQMSPYCTLRPPIARATFSSAALSVPKKRRRWPQAR